MTKTQAELEKKLEETLKPLVAEAMNALLFDLVDTMACEIIDRGLDEYWEDEDDE